MDTYVHMTYSADSFMSCSVHTYLMETNSADLQRVLWESAGNHAAVMSRQWSEGEQHAICCAFWLWQRSQNRAYNVAPNHVGADLLVIQLLM